MREGYDSLEKLLRLSTSYFIDQNSQQNSARHLEYDSPHTDDQRIFHLYKKLLVGQHLSEIRHPNPRAVPQPAVIAEIAESQCNARHGNVTDDNILGDHRNQHEIK